ncbi:MAG TPA: hypothetical protein VFE60_13020 [Roseiarcus sp.]|nr:hypothetical protein [Roseiarcus sp.]
MREKLRSQVADMLGTIRDRHNIRLGGGGADAITSWFLGPKGENAKLMQDLASRAVEAHLNFRRDVYPDDPMFIRRRPNTNGRST